MNNYTKFAAALCVCAAGAAQAAPVQWGGTNSWYELVTTPLLAPDAEIAAEATTFMGASGYLANITSAAEFNFVGSLLDGAAIIGLSDRETEGTFKYIGGPEEGETATYLPWLINEPNDFDSGEDYVEILFSGNGNGFNDIAPPTTAYDATRAYLIEYTVNDSTTPVPLPAGLPLLLAGLGAFGLLRRRQT